MTAALIAPTVLVDSAGIITNGPNKPCSDAGIVTFTTPPELGGAGGGSDESFSNTVSPLTSPDALRVVPSTSADPPNQSA